ncbi:MAG: single-stranded-DNA-specific exonuclease RecJ [Bacteroidetes bacterium]|nr:MAG: single-stranded-DNA-specific exonuclease RecJ [Bacteroidota bacterium]
MKKRWLLHEKNDAEKKAGLAHALNLSSDLAELLIQRGVDSFQKAEQFFRPKLENQHPAQLFKNMDLAVERLRQAIEEQQNVLLYGDYDVDGTCSVALMLRVLKNYLPSIDYYIPDRYAEGYGLSVQGIEYARKNKSDLIITLDCGIKACDRIAEAKNSGIDVIVCDHHVAGNEIPDAIILDPKQKDCNYPYQGLSGCGVAFKLLHAFFEEQDLPLHELYEHLDLLAISIAGDLVPMTDENRIYCALGLQLINTGRKSYVRELLKGGKTNYPLNSEDLVFRISPRINAAGRMDHATKAVKLMTSEDESIVSELARELEQFNEERRALDQQTFEEAMQQISEDDHFHHRYSTIVYQKDWQKGVIGIVASRLIEQHYRPTIVLCKSNGKLTGSARGIYGLHLYELLEACSSSLEQFGGHEFAAGLSLEEDQLEHFKTLFDQEVQRQLKAEDSEPIERADLELNFDQIFQPGENVYHIPKFKRILRQLEPHGPENLRPAFIARKVFAEDVKLLKDQHLKMKLRQPESGIEMQAIGFFMPEKLDLALGKEALDVLYSLSINSWNGQESLQIQIRDLRPSE